MESMAQGSTLDSPYKNIPRFSEKFCSRCFIENESTIHILNKYASMFRRTTESNNTIEAIVTHTLEQLNIDFSITYIFPGEGKPDIVIENENNKYRYHFGI